MLLSIVRNLTIGFTCNKSIGVMVCPDPIFIGVNMSINLETLRELTPQLDFPPTLEKHPGVLIHKMTKGTSIAFALLQQDEISVAKWFNSANTEFPVHTHRQREWMIVYEGSMFITIANEEEQKLIHGEYTVVDSGITHSIRFTEDTWYLSITMSI